MRARARVRRANRFAAAKRGDFLKRLVMDEPCVYLFFLCPRGNCCRRSLLSISLSHAFASSIMARALSIANAADNEIGGDRVSPRVIVSMLTAALEEFL